MHLYVTLYYSRFMLIPIRVIWTKLIIVKSLILIIITTINMTIFIYILFFLCMGLRVDVHVSTSITVHYNICYHASIYDFMIINFHHHWISLMSTSWNKFYTVLCHLVRFMLCIKITQSLSFIIEFVYVSLMSKPCKWTPKCFNCNLCVFKFYKNTFL